MNAFFGTDLKQAEQLVEAGLDRHLVEQLRAALSPGDSGLVIYIPPESLAEANRLSTVLSLFEGRLYHAEFPEEVEKALLTRL